MSFQFKTTPYAHQLEEWEHNRDAEVRAIFWEQGTGKSKLVIDTAAWLYARGGIDGLLIIAPNGVHTNWTIDEIPTHMPDFVPVKVHAWSTKSSATQWHALAVEKTVAYDGLAILAMSYDAFMTTRGRKAADAFVKKRQTLYVLDESQRIKSPSAKRTQSVVAHGKRGKYRRILSGTPVTNTPLDIYSQLKFLCADFWPNHGFASYEAFKTYFGIWQTMVRTHQGVVKESNYDHKTDGRSLGRFSRVIAFQNLDELRRIVASIGSRVTKDVLDPPLPPKVYTKRYFELTGEQKRLYAQVRDEFMAFLDSGELVTAPLLIVRLLRLQQIACGYVPDDDCETMHFLGQNPRMKALLDTLADVEGQAIIFARFRQDVNQIMAELGEHAVRYDGQTDQDGRILARQRFQAGDVRFFVGNPAAAGTGLTLTAAKTVIYYSNSFNLEHRLQSEDRAHRIGQDSSVLYVDLMARGTVDTRIVTALRKKLNIASEITGDRVREWL